MGRKQRRIVIALLAVIVMCSIPVTAWAGSKIMYVGRTYTINVAGNYKWSTVNRKIARVDSKRKKITPLKPGTTYIKGSRKTKYGTNVRKIKIVVKIPYINKKSATVAAGKKFTLKLTGTNAVRWTSSNKKVAVVSSKGVVQGKKAGSVKITATGKNKKKYTCVLKVVSANKKTSTTSQQPKKTENHNAYRIAHRGDMKTAPENTMSAFRMALANGYRSVETDVQFTKDCVPVLLHSAAIDRTSNGKGRIADLTFAEVRKYDFGSWKSTKYRGEKIPSFQEFIEFCKENSIHPYIELKEETITDTEIKKVQMLYQIVCAAGMQDKVSWFSFRYELVSMMKKIDPTADVGMVIHAYDRLTDGVIGKLRSLQTGRNTVFVSDYAKRITPAILAKCKKDKIELVARDIKNIRELYGLDLYYRAAFADGI